MTKLKTLMLLAATTVLTTGIGLPAWSAMHAASEGEAVTPLTSLFGSDGGDRPMILAEDEQTRRASLRASGVIR